MVPILVSLKTDDKDMVTATKIRRVNHIGLLVVILVYLVIAQLYSTAIPLGKAPDEYVHFLYTRFLIENQRPPTNFDEQQLAGYKSDQPPFYHSLVALLTAPIDVSEPPSFKFSWEPPSRQLIDIVLPRALLILTADETWPYKGLFLAWFAGRWLSILLSSITLITTYFIAQEIFPKQDWLALAAMATLAFIPRFIFIGSVLSDDNMVGLLMALFLYAVVRFFKYNKHICITFAIMGVLVGLALSTKYTVLPVPLEVLVLAVWLGRRNRWPWRKVFINLAAFGLTLTLFAGVWFGFMWRHFNQISEHGLVMGLIKPILAGGNNAQETDAILKTVTGGGIAEIFSEGNLWNWVLFLFTQFWDVPIAGVPQHYPLAVVLISALLLCVLAGVGWWRRWQKNELNQRMWLGLLALHVFVFLPIPFLRFIAIGDIHDTAQARHLLFPAAPAIAILLVAGVVAVFPRQWERIVGFAMVGFVFTLTLAHLYYYHIGFPNPLPVRTAPSLAAAPETNLSIEFADGLHLQGYDWEQTHDQVLHINLFWRATTPVQTDYRTEISLRDSSGKQQPIWLSHPAEGRFPTRAWDVGDSIQDTLKIPLNDLSPNNYEVILTLLDWDDVPLSSSQGHAVELFSFTPNSSNAQQLPSLWQNGQRVNSPTYRYRSTIPLTGFDGQGISLVDASGQKYLPTKDSEAIDLFMVDYNWPSGDYWVYADDMPTELTLNVENFSWDFESILN